MLEIQSKASLTIPRVKPQGKDIQEDDDELESVFHQGLPHGALLVGGSGYSEGGIARRREASLFRRLPGRDPSPSSHRRPPLPIPSPAGPPKLKPPPLPSDPFLPLGLLCMGDPELDSGFEFDEDGRTDILGSPFFDVFFGADETADEYLDRILYRLSLALEEHITPGRWIIIGPHPPPPPPAIFPSRATVLVTFSLSFKISKKTDLTNLCHHERQTENLHENSQPVNRLENNWTKRSTYSGQDDATRIPAMITRRSDPITFDVGREGRAIQ
ncbi:hypothetical protein M5K25_013176 [Dendrobium thyrsiflorum]|uniref:Uncharacterized protein n=1 Tax=Dendrobium thyrsiflorum TaxID=117978 RepID=A0ABD0US64_DENTH